METILHKAYLFDRSSHQSHFKIPIYLKQEYQYLKIYFSYGPKFVSDDQAIRELTAALRKSSVTKDAALDPCDYLPLENLVTLSLSREGKYLGCRHNKAVPQEITIGPKHSSLGFIPQVVLPGNWEIQLNLHCQLSDALHAHVLVTGEEQK